MNLYAFTPAHINRNKKTGPIVKCSAPAINCPDSCPLKGNGCYAENFPLALQWLKQQAGTSPWSCTWEGLLGKLKRVAKHAKVRMWEAGDFPVTVTGAMDPLKLLQLTEALRGKRAWAYTHHIPGLIGDVTADFIRSARSRGFTINLSFDNKEVVMDAYMNQGHSCVLAVPSTETRRGWRTPGGNRVRVCPAHFRPGEVSCASCDLCHTRPADLAIAFPAHGTKAKSADQVLTGATP